MWQRTLVKASHLTNALSPISLIDAGKVMAFKLVQQEKASFSIVVIVSGRVISCMSHLPQKALLPMAVMPSGIFEVLQPTTSLLVAVSMIALQSERESYTVLAGSTLICFKLEQLAKESPLMLA